MKHIAFLYTHTYSILIQETRSIRVTDLKEYSEDFLPKARMRKLNEMEIIRNVIMKEFNAYKKKNRNRNRAEK